MFYSGEREKKGILSIFLWRFRTFVSGKEGTSQDTIDMTLNYKEKVGPL